MASRQQILTLNSGSSSIKFALFEGGAPLALVLTGAITNIGQPSATFTLKRPAQGAALTQPATAPDHAAAIAVMAGWIETSADIASLIAIGHRLVYGGENHIQPVQISPALLDDLKKLIPFDPQHLPSEILLAETLLQRFATIPHFACFDTAFHAHMPRVAQMLPIPRKYEALGARRYGFHGLSYTFLMQELARLEGVDVVPGAIILAHLGNGASLAAVRDGKPVDTSMGFSPASGVMMGSRSGDLDPGLVSWLMRAQNVSIEAFDRMVNFQSGLLGVSDTSPDMRALLATQAQDSRAAEAVALFCYQVKKSIGAFAAVLGGVDQLVFSGGIGEKAPEVRARICEGLHFLGLEIDAARNGANARLISPDSRRVKVRVIPTDEESIIVKAVMRLMRPDVGHG